MTSGQDETQEAISDQQVLSMHLRAAVRSAVMLIPTSFVIGAVGGWALGFWNENRSASAGLIVMAGALVIWLTWAYHRTQGLFDHTGFGSRED